ncbi:TPA: polysaccharide biosynthesis C-terminal domain-containing protein [Photobacterium damselae]
MKKNIKWMIFDKFTSVIFSFASIYMISKALGIYEFATYSFNISSILIALGFARFGLNQYVIKRLSTLAKVSGFTSNTLLLRIVISILTLLFSITLFSFIIHNSKYNIYFNAIIILYSLEVYEFLLISRKRFDLISKCKIIVNSVVFLMRLFGFLIDLDVNYFFFCYTIQFILYYILCFLISRYKYSTKYIGIRFSRIFLLTKKTYPLWFASIFTAVFMQIDQLLIGYLSDSVQLANYAISVSILTQISIIAILISNFSLPYYANYLKHKSWSAFFCLWIKINIIIFILFLLFSFVISNVYLFIAESFLSEQYILSSHIFKYLIYLFPLIYLNLSFYNLNILRERNEINTYAAFLGMIINISFNLVLIPRYGAIGSVISSMLSYFSMITIYIYTNLK